MKKMFLTLVTPFRAKLLIPSQTAFSVCLNFLWFQRIVEPAHQSLRIIICIIRLHNPAKMTDSPPRAQGGGSWEALAAKLKGSRSTGSVASENMDTNSDRNSFSARTPHELDTSDTRAFPPPNADREREMGRRRKRDINTGWTFRGSNSEGKGGVNVLKRDAGLLDLAVEGKTTLEAQLVMASKPIIGLDQVVEYIDPEADHAPRVYYCTMCAVFRSVATIMEHITSFNHRVRAIRKRFPNEVKSYLLPDGKTINRSPALSFVAQKRAAEIELVYGRGNVEVRRERPTYPDDAMDAEESFELQLNSTGNLENYKKALDHFKGVKIETQEESRVVKAIIDTLQDALIEWRVRQNRDD